MKPMIASNATAATAVTARSRKRASAPPKRRRALLFAGQDDSVVHAAYSPTGHESDLLDDFAALGRA
ncbi:MAG: hypothetical protein ACOX5G_06530 [Kiritimatiellia bacterium]